VRWQDNERLDVVPTFENLGDDAQIHWITP
jgi:hypothetical protein